MIMEMEYKQVTKEDLDLYEDLMLPMVYEELSEQEDIETEYLGMAAWEEDAPVGVIITELSDEGDIQLLSVWTDINHRRMGVASDLYKNMLTVARQLYDFDEDQFGDDISVRAMYCLSGDELRALEGWLTDNDFSDLYILREGEDDRPAIRGALSDIHFYRY